MESLALTTFRFPSETCIPQAQPKIREYVAMDSAALDVMTDLAIVKAETIEPDTPLAKAEQVMINRGVRSLFVTSNFPCVDGVVTASDLVGNKSLRAVNQLNVKYSDLCVADVMTALPDLDVIDYDELKSALVDRVVASFQKLKCTHILVVQTAKTQGPARIRGIISLTQVERQLGRNIVVMASEF